MRPFLSFPLFFTPLIHSFNCESIHLRVFIIALLLFLFLHVPVSSITNIISVIFSCFLSFLRGGSVHIEWKSLAYLCLGIILTVVTFVASVELVQQALTTYLPLSTSSPLSSCVSFSFSIVNYLLLFGETIHVCVYCIHPVK